MKLDVVIESGVLQWQQMPEELRDGVYEISINNLESRTTSQNSAQYLWLTMIAKVLNDANITTTQILKPDIEWTMDKVKAVIFDPLIFTLYGVKSSTKLNKSDYTLIIDTMTKIFGERGVELPPFPSVTEKQNKGTI